jgi:hypothetical protein
MPEALKTAAGRDIASAMECSALHDHLPTMLTAAFGALSRRFP